LTVSGRASTLLEVTAIAVLGPLTVDGDANALAPRERAILAALVVCRGNAVSADVLWPDRPPTSWAKMLQNGVVRLRKLLGAAAIETHQRGYCLVLPADEIDARRFERLVDRARELNSTGASERAAHLFGEALALWRGPPFADLDGWEPGRIEATRLEELRLDAEEARLDAALRAGRHQDVLAAAKARVAEQPLREHRWALLALAQYQSCQQADALRTIRQARHRLAEELGLDPGPTLTELEEAILQQDASLAAAATLPEPSATCPYQGLVPYDTEDADAFFGRDVEVSECLRRLADTGVLVVVGPSGSGKSSLVRAGVASALERDGRRVAVISPGAHPMDALAVAAPSRQSTVLIVDQCEEAVTVCTDAAEQSRFFTALAEHTGPLVVALRADRLGDLAAHPAFARLVERGLYLLKAMDEAGLRAAIEGPARRAGLLIEPGLVDLLVRDVEGEPGALPLLSHALAQTWANREGRTLTVAGYHASGGIRGAVAQTAELVYEQAEPEQRSMLRDLMLRLVTPSPEGEPVRSRIPRRVVATDADHEQVIELLVGARLVTSDEEMVELAHEALARAWPRLRGWLDDDVEGQRTLRHLSLAADTWDAMGRPAAELYRGTRLTWALEWRERSTPDLSTTERDFLTASRRHAVAERNAARRRRRAMTTALAAGLAVTIALATIALVNQRRASREADRANAEAQRATEEAERADLEADRARAHALAASSVSVLDEDPTLAKLLAVASATGTEPTLESTSALHRAWFADRVVARHSVIDEYAFPFTDLDPDGRRMVVAGAFPVEGSGHFLEVAELPRAETSWRFELSTLSAWVGSPLFADDGAHVVAGVYWDPYNRDRVPALGRDELIDEPPPGDVGALVWDAGTGELVEQHDLGRCGGLVAGASDTHLLVRALHGPPDVVDACDWAGGTMSAELLDRDTGARQLLAEDSSGYLWGAAMSGDGRVVAYDAGGRAEVVVIDASTGERLLRFEPHTEQPGWGVRALNEDGSLLLYGDQPMQVWDVDAGEVVAEFEGHQGSSLWATFSPSGRTVLSSGADGTVREWDATTAEELWAYPGVGEGRVAATENGLVLVGAAGQPPALIDRRAGGELGAVETCPGFTQADSLRVTGGLAVFQTVCDGDVSATTYVVDVDAARVLYELPGHQAQALGVSPDGTRFVRQEGEGTVHGPLVVRDLRSGDEIVELQDLCTWDTASPQPPEQQDGCREPPETPFGVWAWRLKWSPDGSMIAAASFDTVAVWDAETGALLFADRPDPARLGVADVIFSADGQVLLATSNDNRVRNFSTATWEVVGELPGGYAVGLIGFTPDGSKLLAAGQFMANTGASLHWNDMAATELTVSRTDVHEGSLRSVAISSDGALVATAGSDGLVRVWDGPTLELVHEIPLGDTQVQGVAFVDDRHLAVTPHDGGLLLVTIDPDELLDLASGSLTRGFSATECTRFGFDADDCPTLSELRGQPDGADDPAALNGTYEVRWRAEEFAAAVTAAGRPMLPLMGPAELYPGSYTVTFADGRFDIVHDGSEAYCTGSYTVYGDSVRMLAERIDTHDSRYGCLPGRTFLDATFQLSDNGLRLTVTTGAAVDTLLFASRDLARVE
jgi:WD40 repeat protein/DNA-binding SARP family transcriptional activator